MPPKKKTDNRNLTRDKRNREAGLAPVAPKYWVVDKDKEKASKAIREAVEPFTKKAKSRLKKYYDE